MKLLISPKNVEEAKKAIAGGADIIDVKNPGEGSLGANFPWVVEEIRAILPKGVELSATIGDLDFKPGTASLAAKGLASTGVDYVKAGFFGIREEKEAWLMAHSICRAVEDFDSKVVIAGYADFREINAIPPLNLLNPAREAGAHGIMIDTALKNGRGLLQHLSLSDLEFFVEKAHELDLEVAMAGSLCTEDIGRLRDIGLDIIGVRGAVCNGRDRINGAISKKKVVELKRCLVQ